MKQKNKGGSISLKKYFNTLETAVLHPKQFSQEIIHSDLKTAMYFFITNSIIWLVFSVLIKTVLLKRQQLIFSILSEITFFLPLIFLAVFLFSLTLHIIAKLFGAHTKFKNSLKAVFFSTLLIPFFAVPVFKVPAVIISFYILLFCFKSINRFDKFQAFAAIVVPVSIIVSTLALSGIININLMTR